MLQLTSVVVMLKEIFVCLNYRGSGCDEFITHGANKLSLTTVNEIFPVPSCDFFIKLSILSV